MNWHHFFSLRKCTITYVQYTGLGQHFSVKVGITCDSALCKDDLDPDFS